MLNRPTVSDVAISCTPAWLLAWHDKVVPVPSTRSLAHLEMNASAPGIRLARDVCVRLGELFPP